MSNLNRRRFIKKSGLYIGAASTVGTNFFGTNAIADDNEYDFIVIGSGAGGGPLACNLAKAGFKTLIIEAGSNKKAPTYSIPAFHGLSTQDPEMAWDYFVKHHDSLEKNRRDSKYVEGKGILYPRAATLGGCTAHNAMITMYPDDQDWTHLMNKTTDRSWHPDQMHTYFERVERSLYKKPGMDDEGWLRTEQSALKLLFSDFKLLRIVLAALKASGYKRLIKRLLTFGPRAALELDPNEREVVMRHLEGLVRIPMATHNGKRNGPRELIMETLEHPVYGQNLTVITEALVSKLIFEQGSNSRIAGVEYYKGKSLYGADSRLNSADRMMKKLCSARLEVKARREVIVSAGAFNTPQLLMLSGIGDFNELPVGIEKRVHLKGVGKNLQDRYEVGVVSELKSEFGSLEECTFNINPELDPCLRDYMENPSKHLYGTNGVIIGVKQKSDPTLKDPDLFIFAAPGEFKGYFPNWGRESLQKDKMTWAVLHKGHNLDKYYGGKSGYVKLKSKDFTQTPEINFRNFDKATDPSGKDLNAVMEGVKFARKINKSLDGFVTGIIEKETIPSKEVDTDKELKQFIQDEAWGHHASCTAKMGHRSDSMSVIDGEFKVHGIENLRVVDASSFDRIPGLFIVAPIYMISEKASDIIIRDHSLG